VSPHSTLEISEDVYSVVKHPTQSNNEHYNQQEFECHKRILMFIIEIEAGILEILIIQNRVCDEEDKPQCEDIDHLSWS